MDEILDQLPSIHSELSATINSVVSGVVCEVKALSKPKSTTDEKKSNSIQVDVNMTSIQSFLNKYAPMQLLIDRRRQKVISLRRKNLEIMTFLRNAQNLLDHVESMPDSSSFTDNEKCVKISKLLNTRYNSAVPHPLWKPTHDAVLVFAIAKHGWLESRNNCHDIEQDGDIRWGKPFDEGAFSPQCNEDSDLNGLKEIAAISRDQVTDVAERVAHFLNSSLDIKEFKGFNLNLVVKSYGLTSSVEKDDNGQVETTWRVDKELIDEIIQERGDSNSPKKVIFEDLPPKKDLVRRAKTILSNASEIKATQEQPDGKEYKFIVLDQGNVLNVFLAELLREVLKQNQKGMALQRRALEYAVKEARHLIETIPEGKDQDDFEKLCGHVEWINRNRSKMSRPVKNVLRAMLDVALIPPVNPDDKMFPIDINQGFTQRFKSSKKMNESAVGDLAINKAISIAKQKLKTNKDDLKDLLGITTIETLILSVMCSQGIPIWTETWEYALTNDDELECIDEFLISWFHMGNVLEVAADKWVQISQLRLEKAERDGSDVTNLQEELEARIIAHEEAMRLHQKPIYLAKKTIMLIEAIRLHMGNEPKSKSKGGVKPENGIGSRIFLWNKNHLTKWAKALGIVSCDDGKTMSATVISIRPESKANGYLDKRNCRAIFTQISQQTRLRSLFSKYDRAEMVDMVGKAVKNVKRSGDSWQGEPTWWNSSSESSYDYELLTGVLQFGYGGFEQMIQEIECFAGKFEAGASDDRLYRSSVQQRVNSMTRELSGMDDSNETMRLMNERKGDIRNNNGNGNSTIQVGIDAFFKSSDAISKSTSCESNNFIAQGASTFDESKSDDDSEIEVVAVISPKRKGENDDTDVSKKRKI